MTGVADEVRAVAAAIRTAPDQTEAWFTEVAGRLEGAVETVTALTGTFNALLEILQGDSLAEATSDLAQLATRVEVLGRSQGDAIGLFKELARLIAGIASRVARIGRSINTISILATNASIAAAYIEDNGVDFARFAGDIRQILQSARTSLDQFADELAGVGRLLRAAIATRSALDERQADAARNIPLRLSKSVAAAEARHRHAATAAVAVKQASQRIGQQIGEAVMALQIGDSSRQRIEHVIYALDLIGEVTVPAQDAQPDRGNAWAAALTEAQRGELARFGCQLQSAQLIDTADHLHSEVEQILASLRGLTAETHDMLRLGTDTFGASHKQHGTFVGELGHEVGAVDALLAGFRAARREADKVSASVSEATTQLISHISGMRSLEADIHIMGLNMTFKCGRLGVTGRSLGIIAQELRRNAKEIATEAGDLMAELNHVATLANGLLGSLQAGTEAEIADITAMMGRALGRLSAARQNLADAWSNLERDGHVVSGLLHDTMARAHMHDQLCPELRSAATRLAAGATDLSPAGATLPPQADELLTLFADRYTMEAERIVLLRHAPERWQGKITQDEAELDASPTAADLDDILF